MSRRREKKGGGSEEAGGGSERWLLTYADMITLLLALFIVLFAMATLDPIKYEALRRTLSNTFTGSINTGGSSVLDNGGSVLDPAAESFDSQVTQLISPKRSQELRAQAQHEQLYEEVEEAVKSEGIKSEEVDVTITERGVVIHLSGDAFFPSGSATLNTNLIHRLDKVIASFKKEHSPLAIEGHTDGAPINTAQFPSNWELSAARALAVSAYLRSQGILPKDLTGGVVGYADTQPIQKPQYPEQSIAKNRRVDIVVLGPAAGTGTQEPANGAAANGNGAPAAQPIKPIPDDIIGDIVGRIG